MTSTRCAAALAAALTCSPACGETHALIMAISNYSMPGVTPLKGVVHDVASAQGIARRLGVKDANIVVLRDGELSLRGMTHAFDELHERVAPNDNVFIYYSGHGSRYRVSDPAERCAESLVAADGEAFLDAALEARLKTLAGKANKLVVFVDACHSGGVTTRMTADPRFTPKYLARNDAEACEVPVNVLKRSIALGARSVGSGADNYVYIAAARDNEVSLDEAERGGIATQAWHQCVSGAALDLDASGGISAEEVRICAQQLIDQKLQNIQGFSPHHISITGNSRALLGLVSLPDSSAAAEAAAPAETLKDIYSQRDDRRTVSLKLAQPQLRIGRDALQLTVTSERAGHVYLLMAGSDGKTFDMLFPNRLDTKNQIEAGQTLQLPRPSWQITAAGPAGATHLLAIVSDAPRDFSKLGMKPAGAFSVLEASRAAAKDIQLVTATAPGKASSAYGAALVTVEEVK
jgi:hypothetical protein